MDRLITSLGITTPVIFVLSLKASTPITFTGFPPMVLGITTYPPEPIYPVIVTSPADSIQRKSDSSSGAKLDKPELTEDRLEEDMAFVDEDDEVLSPDDSDCEESLEERLEDDEVLSPEEKDSEEGLDGDGALANISIELSVEYDEISLIKYYIRLVCYSS